MVADVLRRGDHCRSKVLEWERREMASGKRKEGCLAHHSRARSWCRCRVVLALEGCEDMRVAFI